MKMLSQIASVARGSVGGLTFTANQFSQIIVRQRTAPVQPNTVNQTKIRAAFTTAQTQWEALTTEERQGWIDYADSLTFSGPTGTYKVPGRQVFLSNFGWSLYLLDRGVPGQTILPAPPENTGFAAIQNLNVDVLPAPGTGYAVVGNNNNPENMSVIVMNSRAFNPARERYKGPFKSDTIFSASVAAGAPFTISVTGLIAASRYFCSIRAVTVEDAHRLSPLFYLNTIATTVEADVVKSSTTSPAKSPDKATKKAA